MPFAVLVELCLWSMSCKCQNLSLKSVQLCSPLPSCSCTRLQQSRRWRSQGKKKRPRGWWWRLWWIFLPPFPPRWCSCSPGLVWDTRGRHSSSRCCPNQCSTTQLPFLPQILEFWLGFCSGCGRRCGRCGRPILAHWLHVSSNLDKCLPPLSWKKVPFHIISNCVYRLLHISGTVPKTSKLSGKPVGSPVIVFSVVFLTLTADPCNMI